MRIAARFVLVAVIAIALSFACNWISLVAWRTWPETFAEVGVSSLPFYLSWATICVLATLALHVTTPWRIEWSRSRSIWLAAVIAASIVMYLPAIRLAFTGAAHVPTPLLFIVSGGIVGPIVEEWLFRGIVWELLRRSAPGRTGLVAAIVGGALIFGFWHLPFDGVSWFGVQLAFMHAAFGILMGVSRWRFDSILPGVLMHAIGNSLYVITH